MCVPALAPLLVPLVIASSTAQFVQGRRQANRQNAIAMQNAQNAVEAARRQNDLTTQQFNQQRTVANQEQFMRAMEAARAQARVRASAGEAGVSGDALATLVRDFNLQAAVSRQVLRTNFQVQGQQFAENTAQIQATAQQRIAQQPTILGPSPVAAALGGLSQAALLQAQVQGPPPPTQSIAPATQAAASPFNPAVFMTGG